MTTTVPMSDDVDARLNAGTLLARRITLTAGDDLDAAAALTAAWTRRQLVDTVLALATQAHALRPILPAYLGERLRPDEETWTDAELRAAHALSNLVAPYDRTVRPDVAEGERIHHRLRARRGRAAA